MMPSIYTLFIVAAIFMSPFLMFAGVGRFTGRSMLIFSVGMFGVIIMVNVMMAYSALSTFPGLEVKNSYVASQTFDRDRLKQEALGWTATPDYERGMLSVVIRDAEGRPAPVQSLEVVIGRPTHVREDQTPQMTYEGGVFRVPLQLGAGAWIIHLTATSADGTVFRQRLDHFNGALVK